MGKSGHEKHMSFCPKCGYDQSGEIATWESACPLDGQCPECGIEFAWVNVIRPQQEIVRWYIEHAPSLCSMIWRTPKTLLMLAWPIWFWNRLDILKRVSIFKLLVWSVLVLSCVHLLVAITNAYNSWFHSNWFIGQPTFVQFIKQHQWHEYPDLLVNGMVYPYFVASNSSKQPWWMWDFEVFWSEAWYEYFVRQIVFPVGVVLLWCVVLLAIPQSRRIAKIRKAHFSRAIILSVLMIALSYELNYLYIMLYNLGFIPQFMYWHTQLWIMRLAIVWQLLFWGSAVVIGWQIRPWKLMVILGSIAALLGGAALKMYTFLAYAQSSM